MTGLWESNWEPPELLQFQNEKKEEEKKKKKKEKVEKELSLKISKFLGH